MLDRSRAVKDLMKVIMPLYGGNPSLLRPFGRDGKPLSATDQMVQAFADNPRPRVLQASGGQAPPEIYMQPALRFSDSDLDAELRSEVNNSLKIVNFFHKIQNFRQISDLFSQI